MEYYLDVLKKYAVFEGRASRKEYWMFVLFNTLISLGLGIFGGMTGSGDLLGNIYSLAVLVPSIAVGVRRMHDVGKSGWFLLIPIYNLILALTEGEKGPNQYGPDPYSDVPGSSEVLDEDLL